jgi:hypothetical protein
MGQPWLEILDELSGLGSLEDSWKLNLPTYNQCVGKLIIRRLKTVVFKAKNTIRIKI